MASTQYDHLSREELVRELEAAKEMTRNRELSNERLFRIARVVDGILEATKEVSRVPELIEKLEEDILQLIHDCEIFAKDLENISKDMRSCAKNGVEVQSFSAVTGIAGGVMVILAPSTGGLSLIGAAALSGTSGVVGVVGKICHDESFQNLQRKSQSTLAQYHGRSNVFKVPYEQIMDIRIRFASSGACSEFSENGAGDINAYLDQLLTCLENGNPSTSAPLKTDRENFLIKIISMHRNGKSEEQIRDYIFKCLAYNCMKGLNVEEKQLAAMGLKAYSSSVSFGEFVEFIGSEYLPFIDTMRGVSDSGIVVLSAIITATKNPVARVGTSSVGRTATCSCSLARVVKGFAILSILLEIINLIDAICKYRRETAMSREVGEAASEVRKRVRKLETILESIGTIRKKLKDLFS